MDAKWRAVTINCLRTVDVRRRIRNAKELARWRGQWVVIKVFIQIELLSKFVELTFLILDKSQFGATNDEIESLVGDSNIFIKDEKEKIAEIEIMIAETSARGKKFGWEAVLSLLKYSIEHLNLKVVQAIIGESNSKSISMFKKLKFEQKSQPNVFKEISFERVVDEDWCRWLNSQIENYSVQSYSS